jgi:hypothetical protein
MWHARAARGDQEAIKILAKPDYVVKKKPRKAKEAIKGRASAKA